MGMLDKGGVLSCKDGADSTTLPPPTGGGGAPRERQRQERSDYNIIGYHLTFEWGGYVCST